MDLPLKAPHKNGLDGACILVGEDEILIALDIAATLSEAGGTIIGPCTSISHLLKLAQQEQLSAAILDIQLGRKTTEPVAEALDARSIPFLFYSGQGLPDSMRTRWPKCVILSKPVDQKSLVRAVKALLDASRGV
jgi:DNA-binding response OmpR family regulator